jgi:Ca2+-binding RTX toxin-like protein
MSTFETTSDIVELSQSPFGGQRDAAIVILANGNAVVSWTDEGYTVGGGDGSSWGIKARLIDASGAPIGDEFIVNTVTAGRQDQAGVTALADGGFVVTWLDNAPYGSPTNYAVKAQVYSASGVRQGGELLIGNGRANDGDEVEPSITALTGGGWTVAWIGRDPLAPLVQIVEGRIYGVAGTPDGTAWTLARPAPVPGGAINDRDVSITADTDGGFVVAWLRSQSDAQGRNIVAGAYAQHRLADGTASGAVITFDEGAPDGSNGFYGRRHVSVEAAVRADGSIIGTWVVEQGSLGDGLPLLVRSRGIGADGVALGAATTLGTTFGFPPPEAIDIDALGDGTALVSIAGQAWRVDAAGARIGAELAIASGLNYSEIADVAVREDGSFTVTWTGTRDRGDAILFQSYDFTPTPITDIRIAGALNEAAVGNLAVLRFSTDTRIVNGTVTYELLADPRGLFRIEGDTLVLKAGGSLDFETRPSEAITVRATDAAGNQITEIFDLAVQNAVNEGPAWNAGTILTLSDYAPDASMVSIAGLRDGGIGVAWDEGRDYFRSLSLSADDVASIGFRYTGSEAAIAALANGGYVVSTGQSNGFTTQFHALSFTAAGDVVAPRTQVGYAGFTDTSTDITAFGDGYALAWEPNIFLGYGPYAYTPAIGSGFKNIDPALAELADGRLIVVWERGGFSFARLIGADRQPAAPEFTVSNGAASDPDVAALKGGGFVIAWDNGDPAGGIEFRRYDAAGVAIGTEVTVDAGAAGVEDDVTITGLADGGFVIGWSETSSTDTLALHARSFNAAGTATGARLTIAEGIDAAAAAYPGLELQLTALASDGFAAGWAQDDKVLVRRFERTSRPTANDDTAATDEDVPLVIAPLRNDVDAAAAGLIIRTAEADTGSVTIGTDGTLTYTPDAGWYGTDIIRYAVASPLGGADFGVITITVRASNSPPVVSAVRLAATSRAGFDVDTIVAFTSRDPDVSPQGIPDRVSLQSVGNAIGGTATISNSDIVVTGAAGTLTFDLTVADTDGATGTARASVALLAATNGANILTVATGTAFSRIFGRGGNDTLTGAEGQDYLSGDAGNDRLDGGDGYDTLIGGTGNDTYVADSDDLVIERPDGGIDRIITASGYGLADDFEELELASGAGDISGAGNARDNLLIGNEGSNYLGGNDGDDMLIGGDGNDRLIGDAGIDRFTGGSGDDVIYVDAAAELVFEDAGGGYDLVISTASYFLFDNIEELYLAGYAGDLFGVGNTAANRITGNEGSNLLIGGGGDDDLRGEDGIDALFGESGDDTLNGGSGIDYLVGGNGDDSLEGGADADALYGEDGSDVLNGGDSFDTDILVGGTGNDTLMAASGQSDYDLIDGGAGDDTYFVDTPADLTFEAIGGGTDLVIADIVGAGYYLYANIEDLTLGGTTPFGVGNDLANVLTGSASANYLLGLGGNDRLNGKAGNDVLFGQAGNDIFGFERGTGVDVIGDFTRGNDAIQLTGLGFTRFAQVRAAMFEVAGTTAIKLGQGDLVIVNNIANADLSAADFILG